MMSSFYVSILHQVIWWRNEEAWAQNFNAVSHNRSQPEVLFLNLTWRLRGQISSVLLQLLLFAFNNSKFGRHGKWSVTFWQWENDA